jgi:hypothetical protein
LWERGIVTYLARACNPCAQSAAATLSSHPATSDAASAMSQTISK